MSARQAKRPTLSDQLRRPPQEQVQAVNESLAEIRRLATAPTAKGRGSAMADLAMHVSIFWSGPQGQVALRPASEVIATIRAVRVAAGAGRARTEHYLLEVLNGLQLVTGARQRPAAVRPLARELWAFGLESLAFRRRRDAAAGQRQRQVYQLLANAAPWVPVADVLGLARRALGSQDEGEIAGGLRLLEECLDRRGGDGGPALVRELKAVRRRTRDRDNLVGALNLLIQLGAEDEFGALDSVEVWDDAAEDRAD